VKGRDGERGTGAREGESVKKKEGQERGRRKSNEERGTGRGVSRFLFYMGEVQVLPMRIFKCVFFSAPNQYLIKKSFWPPYFRQKTNLISNFQLKIIKMNSWELMDLSVFSMRP
jgi:hypothetical protein